MIGLMLHEDNAFRIRDMGRKNGKWEWRQIDALGLELVGANSYLHTSGPGAEAAAECARFRRFWGNKSQLRRFKDGTTCEAVRVCPPA